MRSTSSFVTRISPGPVMALGMALIGGGILWATRGPVHGHFWSSLAGPFFDASRRRRDPRPVIAPAAPATAMDFRPYADQDGMSINHRMPRPVVHLELHTGDQAGASAFYAGLLCWRPELVEARCGSYLALELGGGLGGGIVECATKRPLWLPYVEVDQIDDQTEHARRLGARVLLEPREGPAGWRSVVSTPQAGEIAFWQPKR
jgi:predicted enzyme related to lactoylglutathione lyase